MMIRILPITEMRQCFEADSQLLKEEEIYVLE